MWYCKNVSLLVPKLYKDGVFEICKKNNPGDGGVVESTAVAGWVESTPPP
jgi:hypothetical protein